MYPLCLEHIETGTVVAAMMAGPSSPQLAAALSAEAMARPERAREHFETAPRQSREVPVRMLEPAVLYWYGRALLSTDDAADRARGRAMLVEALSGFRKFEMVIHEKLC